MTNGKNCAIARRPSSKSCRPSHVYITHFCQFIDQPLVGLILQIIEHSDCLRLKTWFRRISIWDDRIDFDAHHARGRVNPSFDPGSFALQSHPFIR
jgi:hypothetical protein